MGRGWLSMERGSTRCASLWKKPVRLAYLSWSTWRAWASSLARGDLPCCLEMLCKSPRRIETVEPCSWLCAGHSCLAEMGRKGSASVSAQLTQPSCLRALYPADMLTGSCPLWLLVRNQAVMDLVDAIARWNDHSPTSSSCLAGHTVWCMSFLAAHLTTGRASCAAAAASPISASETCAGLHRGAA